SRDLLCLISNRGDDESIAPTGINSQGRLKKPAQTRFRHVGTHDYDLWWIPRTQFVRSLASGQRKFGPMAKTSDALPHHGKRLHVSIHKQNAIRADSEPLL